MTTYANSPIIDADALNPDDFGFSADASELAWAPGFWPESVYLDGQRYVRVGATSDVTFYYSATAGQSIRVVND